MTKKRISVGIPEELLKKLDNLCAKLGISRSEFITEVLKEKLGMIDQGSHEHPSVLWKLSIYDVLKTRSPKFKGERVRSKWIIEEI
ncbi:MAG: hypothetical protein B6U85_02830 [Desulfurococcales archaeon ex4484_42]|nr:MAG: hypothetical protein B6U85_02830 [Desulfurococcales archaeon ex4484_42]